MKRFVSGADRGQSTLLPECLDDFIDERNPVRVIDVFVDSLDLSEMSFEGVEPAATGRPSYHPSVLLKLYIYGYLNRVQSSRRCVKPDRRCLRLQSSHQTRTIPEANRLVHGPLHNASHHVLSIRVARRCPKNGDVPIDYASH